MSGWPRYEHPRAKMHWNKIWIVELYDGTQYICADFFKYHNPYVDEDKYKARIIDSELNGWIAEFEINDVVNVIEIDNAHFTAKKFDYDEERNLVNVSFRIVGGYKEEEEEE